MFIRVAIVDTKAPKRIAVELPGQLLERRTVGQRLAPSSYARSISTTVWRCS